MKKRYRARNKDDDAKVFIIVTIENIIITVVFAALAVIFEKWWIVLFSILCYTEIRTNKSERIKENANETDI